MSDVIALDVSKGASYGVLYQDSVCTAEFRITHNQSGFSKLLTIVDSANQPTVYFEATGIYSKPLERFCVINELPFSRLNPLELHLCMASLRRVKTDEKDAHAIAETVLQHSFRLTELRSYDYETLNQLNRFKTQIEDDIKLKRVRLHAAVQQTFPELEQLFTNPRSRLALNIVALFPHPDMVLPLSRTKLKHTIIDKTDKRISDVLALKYAEKLLLLANDSYPAVDLDTVQVRIVKYLCHQLIELVDQKQSLVKEMEQFAIRFPEFDLMTSVPGIGEQTAAELIGELGNLRRFDNANQVNAFVGIDLMRYQSGQYQRADYINKRGNTHARKILFMTVKNMVRQQATAKNHIVDYYYKLKKQPNPKREKVAIVAGMNKTIKCLFSMIQANARYDYFAHHGLEVQ